MEETNYFTRLNEINLNAKTEKKGGLTYLSWAYAWGEIKKAYPDSTYTVYENRDGWNYFTDGRTAWVKTGVTVNGLEHIEYLPIMDARNKSIPLGNITSYEVNKAIQRCITKACARHGIGLYIYAGEDLPEEEQRGIETAQKNGAEKPEIVQPVQSVVAADKTEKRAESKPVERDETYTRGYKCECCHNPVMNWLGAYSRKTYGVVLCGKKCKQEFDSKLPFPMEG